jgi:hypothetical protein
MMVGFILAALGPFLTEAIAYIGISGAGDWADYPVAAAWNSMSEQDRADVEHHRRRSFGRSPVDRQAGELPPDIDRLLQASRRHS